LKLFVSPLRRRSEVVRRRPRNFLSKGRRHSYLVRMIKPNLIASHDWHVQPICQRSLRAVRLSGAPGIEAQTFTSRCPRT
jgi:hypothetical protein